MPKAKGPQVVTANDLLSGEVVYLTPEGGWSPVHEEAAVAEEAEAAEALLRAAERQAGRVVGPYLAGAVLDEAGGPRPAHYREVIRTQGPTVRRDLGKQSAGPAGSASPAAADPTERPAATGRPEQPASGAA